MSDVKRDADEVASNIHPSRVDTAEDHKTEDAISATLADLKVTSRPVGSRFASILSEVTIRSAHSAFMAPFFYADVTFTEFDGRIAPAVPVFGFYREPIQSIGGAFRLPTEHFLPRLPKHLQGILKENKIHCIDIFVCIQEFLAKDFTREMLCLRSHFWLVPGIHPPSLKTGGNVQAKLFDFENEIDGDLNSIRLLSLKWSIHPSKKGRISLYSPSNGKVVTPVGAENNCGWSLVLDGGRAAVTLTAFLSNEPFNDSPFDAVVKFLSAKTADQTSLLDLFMFIRTDTKHREQFAPFRRHLEALLSE